mmetsp:Transcript_49217/g.107123  ORF Transcript_49217/g.107123 Transcript_49217/m.107123 type:complete len:207 (+) Transcript_49217:534-1154(+)
MMIEDCHPPSAPWSPTARVGAGGPQQSPSLRIDHQIAIRVETEMCSRIGSWFKATSTICTGPTLPNDVGPDGLTLVISLVKCQISMPPQQGTTSSGRPDAGLTRSLTRKGICIRHAHGVVRQGRSRYPALQGEPITRGIGLSQAAPAKFVLRLVKVSQLIGIQLSDPVALSHVVLDSLTQRSVTGVVPTAAALGSDGVLVINAEGL